MELKTLWLGMLISMSAFAVKTGLGWAYMWSKCPPGRKAAASLALLGLYGLLFFGLSRLIIKVNLLSHYEVLRPLWEKGVTLHWLAAAFLFLWGLFLLKSEPDESCGRGSRGWLALVIPCPVCLSVILMSAAGLALYFPDHSGQALAGLFVAFALLACVSGLVLILGRKPSHQSEPGRSEGKLVETGQPGGDWEQTLGLAMMLMAAYFIISALFMPQFTDISKVYRLAAYAGEDRGVEPRTAWLTSVAILGLLGLGYWRTKRKYKHIRSQ